MNTHSINAADVEVGKSVPSPASEYGEIRALLDALWRRRLFILGFFILSGAIAGAVAWLIPGKYKSEAIVMVQPVGNLADPNAFNPGVPPEIVRSQLEVAQSQSVIGRVVDQLKLMDDPEFASTATNPDTQRAKVMANVAKRLDADNDGRSATIHISFEANEPGKAARAADAFAAEYIRTEGELKSRAIQTTKGRLDGRLGELRQQAFGAEQTAEDYRRSVGLVTLAPAPDGADGSTSMSYSARLLDEFSRQAAGLTASAAQTSAQARDARADMARTGGANTPQALSSTVISSLLQQDADLAKSEAQLASRYTPEHPLLVQVRAQRAAVRRTLAAARGNVETSLRIAANSAAAAEGTARAKARAIAGTVNREIAEGVRYSQLLHEAKIKRKTYEDFAGQSGTISERSLLQLPDAVLVSPASLPVKESWPNRWLIFGLGAFAGLILGCALAVVREFWAVARS